MIEVSKEHFGVRLKHAKGETHLCRAYKERREALKAFGFKDNKRYASETEADTYANKWRANGYDIEIFRGFMLSF